VLALGRAFDSTGSYAFLLVILAVALSVAAATNLLLPKVSRGSRVRSGLQLWHFSGKLMYV